MHQPHRTPPGFVGSWSHGGSLQNARVAVVLTIAPVLLAGCATLDHATGEYWVSYPPGTIVDYQLGGAYPPPPVAVGGVARDSTDRPAPGLYNICYADSCSPGVTACH